MKTKPFGFNSISLAIPADWDMCSYRGDCKSGSLIFDNRKNQTLEASWGGYSLQHPDKILKNTVLTSKSVSEKERNEIDEHRTLLRLKEADSEYLVMLLLLPEQKRYVILRSFDEKSSRRQMETMSSPLLEATEEKPDEWHFFSTLFKLDRKFLLEKASLNAGSVELHFTRDKRLLTIWDISLLDYVAKNTGITRCVAGLLDRLTPKGYFHDDIPEFAEPLVTTVKRAKLYHRGPVLLRPWHMLFGNRRVELRVITNTHRNRLSVLLLLCRKDEETEWLDITEESLLKD